jgi:asparagine synthase (glutamine-hydrolysing)
MCGICGFINVDSGDRSHKAVLRHMCTTLQHRGPDDEGCYIDANAALGIRRLSIIDLATGQQPIANETKSVWVVLNGEIYNYRKVRQTLEQKGHTFRTQSDTEVIVHAYEEYGDRCVNHFNGMFAFALWDMPNKRLLLGRDHLGIKPLYYWENGESIVFGSELKALLAHPCVPVSINLPALDQFFVLEYIPAPYSIFNAVHKLPPGHTLVFEQGIVTIQRYWNIPVVEIPEDERTCTEQLRDLLQDAVRMQLISDVPLGAFLSGGIDSSTVVAFMSQASGEPVETFSIGFDDHSYNELADARKIAVHFRCNHHEQILRPNIADLAEQLVTHLDEPFGDFSIFSTYLVSQLAGQYVKVVLSGDGGDELFGGYDTYVAEAMDTAAYRRLPSFLRSKLLPGVMAIVPPQPEKKGLINKAKRFVEGGALDPAYQHTRWMMFMSEADRVDLYAPDLIEVLNGRNAAGLFLDHFRDVAQWNYLAQQQYIDIKTYLVDDILVKVDRMSMAASIEARVPLLDYRLVEFAVNLPSTFKIRGSQTKWILRQAMRPFLPKSVLTKPKQGFSIPLKHWLRRELKPFMMDLLSSDRIKQRGYFNPSTVSRWMTEHLSGRYNHSHRLWSLMVFELWHQRVYTQATSKIVSATDFYGR